MIHFNPVNAFEQIQGVASEESFQHAKRTVLRARETWKCGRMLLSPKLHLLDSITGVTDDICRLDGQLAVESLDKFCLCATIDEFNQVLGAAKLRIHRATQYLHDQANTINDALDESVGQQFHRFDDNEVVLKIFWLERFLRSIGVFQRIEHTPIVDLLAQCRSLLYYGDVQFAYMKRMCLDRQRSPDMGDSADLLQTVYLDVCDYIVTDDRDLREIMELTKNPELSGRTIGFDDLKRHLDAPFLGKRAMNPGRRWTAQL